MRYEDKLQDIDEKIVKEPASGHPITPVARQAKIAELVRQHKRVTVNKLADLLEASKETIRRDLTSLAKSGKIQKFHGGAILPESTGGGAFSSRMGDNVTSKVMIAAKAKEIISPGETVFIDTGSTTVYFAEKIAEISNLTVITNSTKIATIISLAASNSTAVLLGGQFSGGNTQTLGSLTITQATLFRAHHAVLTIGAIDSHTGIMDYSIDEAQVAQTMINQAEQVTILADSSKFETIASCRVCDLNRVQNFICDQPPSEKLFRTLRDAGVNVIIAN